MRHWLITGFSVLVILIQTALAALPKWSYDPGPDPKSKMGKELIDLTAAIPNMPELSEELMASQKFRPAFGPVSWRMLLGKNKVKILFIGQDATHIAEAAGRPATAGFGGRAQDLAAYFGVNEGAAFINTYAFTIKGQYGAFSTPYIFKNSIRFGNVVDNGLWLLGHDVDSPVTVWRNDLIDWIIRNNKDSLKLIVTFGGAARDAMGAFIEARGGKVEARREQDAKSIQLAWTKLMYAGGNNEFPALVNEEGQDLYQEVMGKKINYEQEAQQNAVKEDLKRDPETYLSRMIRTDFVHPAQVDGYELDKITLRGKNTRSLKGVKLNDGSSIASDVLVVELPHPTYLTNVGAPEASKAVAKNLTVLKPYVDAGWSIPADPGMTNKFARGESYQYSRADIGPEYYDFGTPGTRMVPVSTASRMSGNPHVIVFGTRDRAAFDMAQVRSLTEALPNEEFTTDELFITRPRSPKLRYTFDPGPGEELARVMKESLDLKAAFKLKDGKSWKTDGIDAYYVKNHPDIGDYGHYRGTFDRPEVLIIADPQGHDDLMTARALTGERGQFLHGVMKDLGVNEKYLVVKTVPFSMDGASDADWKYMLKATAAYRKALLGAVLKSSAPKLIIADGAWAKAAALDLGLKVLALDRTESVKDLAAKLTKSKVWSNVRLSGKAANIPRSHLSFYARTWEGTSGDRVLAAKDGFRGLAFAVVAPAWAFNQKAGLVPDSSKGVETLIKKLKHKNLPMPGESVPSYLRRVKKPSRNLPDAA